MQKILTLFAALLLTAAASGQGVQQQEKIAGLNAYVYYPVGYDTAKVTTYPLILFFPGLGEAGTVASKLLTYGPSRFIASGWKPAALVISVQPTYGWVNEKTIDGVLTAIFSKYRVNRNSVHLTGLSAGGAGIQQYALTPAYAEKITSVVPMSAPEVTTYYGKIPEASKAGVYWLGFAGSYDSHFAKMQDLFSRINVAVPGMARFVVGSYGHCCWNDFYNPAYKLPGTGETLYEWMLSKGNPDAGQPPAPVPVEKYIRIPGDSAAVQKVILLNKSGTWKEIIL